jgi:Ca-activated chloride channel family protein
VSLHHFGFAAPHFLFTLLVVPALALLTVAVRRRRSRYSVRYTNLDTLARVASRRRGRWRRWIPLALLALSLATTAAALARPRIQLVSTDPTSTIILLADVSGSMAATDVKPERIFAAVNAMRTLVSELPASDKVALVTVSDDVEVLDPPTTDRNAIESGLGVLTPEGGTALGAGIETAVKLVVASLAADGVRHVPGQFLPAAIVFISDGSQDRGIVTPAVSAEFAKQAGVRIYAVGLGTRHGYVTTGKGLLTQSIRAVPDPGTIALLARVSDGAAYDATSAPQLDSIYRHIGKTVGRRNDLTEITSWFEVVAAVLLLAGVAAARLRGAALP